MFLNSIKGILLFILNIVKKSLCCFRRRRKASVDIAPLTDIGVIPNNQFSNQEEIQSWNTWDDTKDNLHRPPQTVQEHIEYYRSAVKNQQSVEEVQADYFQDMEPTIKRTPKICLKQKDSSTSASRLNFSPDASFPDDLSELKSWEESENRDGDWADSEEWNTEEILRQKRKEEKRRKLYEKEQKMRGLVS